MNKLPSLKAIQVFEVAARHSSFSHAAHELCVSQSAVSHQIKSLEEHLGKKLFIRANNKVFLTTCGDIYFAAIKGSFMLMQTATDQVMEMTEIKLKVMAHSSIAVDWLAPKLAFFTQQHPNIEVKLSMAVNEAHYDAADFHVIIGSCPTPVGYSSKQIRQESWYPVCKDSVRRQIDVDDPSSILKLPLFSAHNGRDWALWIREQQLDASIELNILNLNDPILTVKAALSGQGVALGCHFIAEDALKSKRLKAFTTLAITPSWGQYFVHYLSGSRYIDLFVDWVMACGER